MYIPRTARAQLLERAPVSGKERPLLAHHYNVPMQAGLRKYWRVLKPILATIIIVAVGRRFYLDVSSHPEIWELPLHPGWLTLCGLLYLVGLCFALACWYRLLKRLEQEPRLVCATRAYFIGQLGKYVPGKAWALFLRATLAGPGVSMGIATMSSFYEVLVTMTSASLLAVFLFLFLAPRADQPFDFTLVLNLLQLEAPDRMLDRYVLLALALVLALATGVPILPVVFNQLVHKLSLPFRDKTAEALPKVTLPGLAEGLVWTTGTWICIGASFVCALNAVTPAPLDFDARGYGMLTAGMCLAYVAGFVILVAPSGLGVREFFLTTFLVPELIALGSIEDPRALAVIVVLLIRLVWTVAEMIAIVVCYFLPTPPE